jgi:hypothetical protein
MKVNCLATKKNNASMSNFIEYLLPQCRLGFKYFPWIISHQKLPELHFFYVKINNLFKIFIHIHHNHELSPLLLL